MLDHLENCKCTPEYYLYMWLQRLQATHSQISAWTTGLPRFDEELLAEIHALCQPDGYLHNSEFGPGTVRGGDALPPGGRVPASTQAETAKRDGRKLIRLVLNNPKISICAHINDPLSPTLLLTAAALTIKKTPAPFFSPDFVDRGEDHASYYDCTDITMSSTLCFVASRDYLYHCMRNHKLSELRILREPTTLQIRVRGLAVPKPIFVGMARERYSVSCSNLALCFSKDRPLKLLSVIRSFLNHSDVCRKRPRDPNDLPGAIHYECTCPLLSVEHSGGGVTIRLNASACALKLVSHTPVINEGCTRSLRISHTSRRAPLQPVSKTQVPCTPYHPPSRTGVVRHACSVVGITGRGGVLPVKCQLETEKCQLETEKCQLETEKCQLETEKCQLETEKCQLETEKCQLETEKCQLETEKCQFTRVGSSLTWCKAGAKPATSKVPVQQHPTIITIQNI
jgi:hypothetical protein